MTVNAVLYYVYRCMLKLRNNITKQTHNKSSTSTMMSPTSGVLELGILRIRQNESLHQSVHRVSVIIGD